MTRFENRITAFSERFLTVRTFELIVEPALADLALEPGASRVARAASYLAVLRAVAGGLLDELRRDSGTFFVLALLPTCYYTFLIIVFADFSESPGGFLSVAALILVLSLSPVMACFWPERRPSRQAD